MVEFEPTVKWHRCIVSVVFQNSVKSGICDSTRNPLSLILGKKGFDLGFQLDLSGMQDRVEFS